MLKRTSPFARAVTLAGVAAGVLLAGAATADDRDLLLEAAGSPYLFVVFDTSTSMTSSPPCTRARALGDMDPFDAMCTSECTLDDAVCAQICPDLGCREYDFSAAPPPGDTPAITRDNGGAGTSDTGWPATVADATAFGGTYLHDNSTNFCGDIGNASFTQCESASYDPDPDLTTAGAGYYMVFLWWPVDAAGAFATNTVVDVVHDDPDNPGSSTTTTLAVDQSLEGGQWNAIGTFKIDPMVSSGVVTIRNENAHVRAVADAVGWLKVGDELPPCLGPQVYRCQQPICNLGDCYTELNGDDPRSKLYQAKAALYEVIEDVPNIQYGFATYEQDDLRLKWKHWLYRVAPVAPGALPTLDGTDFLTGADEVFGNTGVGEWSCVTAGFPFFTGQTGCNANVAADLTNSWDLRRARRIPRLGWDGNATTSVWYRKAQSAAETYRVDYDLDSGSLGDAQIMVDVEVFKCPSGSCPGSSIDKGTVTYDLVTDYVAVDGRTVREPMRFGGFFQLQSNSGGDTAASCNGLDQNDDSAADPFSPTAPLASYNLRWPTTADPLSRGPRFTSGDFVPLDWEDQHRRTLLARLAPNASSGGATPDFRSAVYFNDSLAAGDSSAPADRLLRLVDEDERPVIAFGDTPLGESLREFRMWYEGLDDMGAPDSDAGWAEVAEGNDSLWHCRRKALLVLTDGLEACWDGDNDNDPTNPLPSPPADPDSDGYHDPCPIAADLFAQADPLRTVETFVVGFGLPGGSGSPLACMVKNGRTDAETAMEEPGKFLFLPETKDDLAADLQEVFLSLQTEPKAFASASIPAIQTTAADNIYLSTFTPLPGQPFWPGRIDAFRRPLPLTVDGQPDIDKSCIDPIGGNRQSACHSWEAGDKLCDQAPTAAAAASGSYQLGPGAATQRRIVYGKQSAGSRPNALRLFDVPDMPSDAMAPPTLASYPDAEDLVKALDPAELVAYEAGVNKPSDLVALFERVISETVKEKPIDDDLAPNVNACDTDGDGVSDSYVLGDVFHASPIPISSPNNFTYFARNLFDYRDFARENVWRRRMLAAPTNDGQLHFFDIGVRQLIDNNLTPAPGDKVELFNDGSGHELFSYIPRFALPILRQQVDSTLHHFSLDGTVTVADVYIDPAAALPNTQEWRTILVAGMREGGDVFFAGDEGEKARNFKGGGYFALDVTQPDIMVARSSPDDPSLVPCPAGGGCDETTTVPSEWTPSCLDFDYSGSGNQAASPPSGCGYPFPMELWTFDDSLEVLESAVPLADDGDGTDETLTFHLDEDANGLPDLADTWSRTVIGQIRVCPDGGTKCDLAGDHSELQVLQVVIFGGGLDSARKEDIVTGGEVGGNYLFMLNAETGEVIYKRELEGSAAADPTVLDVNSDGYFDVIYIGTTAGLLYKVDLTAPDASGMVPKLAMSSTVDTTQLLEIDALGGASRFVDKYPPPPPPDVDLTVPRRIEDAAWDPFVIFDTQGTPLYFAAAAFFIPELNQYGLAIGTGDREDLWDDDNGELVAVNSDPVGGRFFVLIDEDFANDPSLYDPTLDCDARLPITQACLKNLAFNVDPTTTELSTDYLLAPRDDADLLLIEPNPRPGWVLTLTPDSRVTNEAFIVSGIIIFAAFDPEIVATSPGTCEQAGTTRAFVVSARNAGPVAPLGDDGGPSGPPANYGERAEDRYQEIDEFTTAPFIDSTATKNPGVEGNTLLDEIDEEVADAIRDSLIGQYPRGSRFNKAFSLVIAALRNSTGVNVYTTIPIAIYPADWRDQ